MRKHKSPPTAWAKGFPDAATDTKSVQHFGKHSNCDLRVTLIIVISPECIN